jgi:release factor glutamine methyltransferase
VTVDEALRLGTTRLATCSSSPRLDSEVLLAHTLGLARSALLAHLSDDLPPLPLHRYELAIERRSQGEPVAYITGHKEFYGLDLRITPDVLVPRPETEHVVDACLGAMPTGEISQLADIGTGSGAILVAVGTQRPQVTLFGTDISSSAIEVARANCEQHGLGPRTQLYVGDLLEPLVGYSFDVIAANLPYVPPGEADPEVATWEPEIAVFGGGEDGTGVIREFLKQAPAFLRPGGRVVIEIAHSQGEVVSTLARLAFPKASIQLRQDLAGYDRIVVIQT